MMRMINEEDQQIFSRSFLSSIQQNLDDLAQNCGNLIANALGLHSFALRHLYYVKE